VSVGVGRGAIGQSESLDKETKLEIQELTGWQAGIKGL